MHRKAIADTAVERCGSTVLQTLILLIESGAVYCVIWVC